MTRREMLKERERERERERIIVLKYAIFPLPEIERE